jgi:uncharacterized protein YcbX
MTGTVVELWRYPVKSLQGERVDRLDLADDGPVGDRAWAVLDRDTGVLVSAKRTGALLEASAVTREHEVIVRLPTGHEGPVGDPDLDRALTGWLGRDVAMVSVADEPTLRQEMAVDNLDEASQVIRWRTPRGRYVDLFGLHLLTTAELADHDVRRFRPNVVIDAPTDVGPWLGRELTVGSVRLSVPDQRTERCVMVTRAQPGLAADRSVLRSLVPTDAPADAPLTVGSNLAVLGGYAEVVTPGEVMVGDRVVAADPPSL